jgi:hypothetical protein
MTSHLAARPFATIAAVLIVALSGAVPSFGQDLLIMVSGPWSYIEEPKPHLDGTSPRIVLIAPYDLDKTLPPPPHPTHMAYYYPGPNASMDYARSLPNLPYFSPSDNQNQNIYYIDFDGRASAGLAPDERHAKPFHPRNQVSDNLLKQMVYAPAQQRYAISLPKPDYVRTYDGYTYGNGLAEAKISAGNVANATPTRYTTWMVLHYTASSIPSQMRISLLTTYDPHGHPSPLSTVAVTTATGRSAISIVLMETHPCLPGDTACWHLGERVCDELSLRSFGESAALWKLSEHARFPRQLDQMGTQDEGSYNLIDCVDTKNLEKVRSLQEEAEVRNAAIVKRIVEINHLTDPSLDKGALAEDLKSLDALFSAEPGGTPPEVANALVCTKALLDKEDVISRCSADVKNVRDAVQKYFRFGDPMTNVSDGLVTSYGKGSADCHSPQIDINNALPTK